MRHSRIVHVYRRDQALILMQLEDLRRVVAARERSIESLRATLESTKQFLEERLMQAGQEISDKDAEVDLSSTLESKSE